jgi:tRNA threonylcarbamoyl adenosine modification protein YeaZ
VNPVPLTLAIEVSNPSSPEPGDRARGLGMGVAVGEGGRLLGKELLHESARHDDDLMPAVDRLFVRLGLAPRDLRRVAVSAGPGGYTALRIAVATAKMLCEATGAACVSVPTALVVARRVEHPRPFAIALQSKGEAAWVVEMDAAADGTGGRIMTAADVPSLRTPLLVADRFFPMTMAHAAAAQGIRIQRPGFDPAACLEAAAELPDIDPMDLLPLYPREPDAVTQWRKRRNG